MVRPSPEKGDVPGRSEGSWLRRSSGKLDTHDTCSKDCRKGAEDATRSMHVCSPNERLTSRDDRGERVHGSANISLSLLGLQLLSEYTRRARVPGSRLRDCQRYGRMKRESLQFAILQTINLLACEDSTVQTHGPRLALSQELRGCDFPTDEQNQRRGRMISPRRLSAS